MWEKENTQSDQKMDDLNVKLNVKLNVLNVVILFFEERLVAEGNAAIFAKPNLQPSCLQSSAFL